MSEVKSFKFPDGDEVVAEVVSENKSNILTDNSKNEVISYFIRRPHVLRMQRGIDGRTVNLMFVPWLLSNPTIERMEIPASCLVIPPFSPMDEVRQQYLHQTSGIELLPPGSKLS